MVSLSQSIFFLRHSTKGCYVSAGRTDLPAATVTIAERPRRASVGWGWGVEPKEVGGGSPTPTTLYTRTDGGIRRPLTRVCGSAVDTHRKGPSRISLLDPALGRPRLAGQGSWNGSTAHRRVPVYQEGSVNQEG